MLFFLYLSGILAMLLGVTLFQKQSKKIKNRNYSDELILRYFAKKMIGTIMIMCLVVIIVSLLLPLLIWTLSPKEVGVVDKIIETDTLSPISSYNKNQYIKEVTDKGVKSYIVNVGESSKEDLQSFDSKSTEIITTNKESAKCEKVAEYTIKKLKGNWIIPKSVNDIYANIYIQYDEGKLISNKIKLFVPDK
ncbi:MULTISPECIES: hypothetical protein [Clostridium]|uniref:Uncharacterized protein n=1 Tax=Clostridium ragsdalei P11 TaxID=1353534 RepID=A0A1A6AW98_9CLOT|nr:MULTISPECIES: hypothetical protein [Clostridium]OBR94322.1 hypothetical protein CLRAG_14890 [Clostridium ragsdalei P11]QXE18423.1 hypothetical protein B5S50_05975 [Clostridium sp. 001]